MRTLIMYYSKTGNAQIVARAIARKMQGDLQELRCDQYLGPAGGFAGWSRQHPWAKTKAPRNL